MRTIGIMLTASALAACTTGPEPQSRSAEAEAKLQQTLAGRVAGEPMTCLPRWNRDNMVVIDDNTILFNEGSTVYRTELQGDCNRLSSGFYTLVTRSPLPSLCRGEIARVVDLRTDTMVGSCAIGDFVPYTRS